MAFTRMTAAEAAALIKNGDNIAMSGFTPAGVAKATTKELAKIAVAEHEAGREFKVGIFTGASTGQSTDGDLANAQAIKYRAPYTTNPDFRKHVNMGEIPYNDLHLSHMAQELRYGFYGDVDWAILEVCDIEEVGNDYHVYLTAAGGISPTAARLAKKVICLSYCCRWYLAYSCPFGKEGYPGAELVPQSKRQVHSRRIRAIGSSLP